MRRGVARLIVAAALIAACSSEPVGVAPSVAPVIDAAIVEANPHNALSAIVSVRVRRADSVAVRFHLDDAVFTVDSVTPAVPAVADSATIAVLGLLPTRRYVLRTVAYGVGGSAVGDSLELRTDTLPSDLPQYTAGGPDPSPGYVVFAAGKYGLVIDNTGRVVWYRRFPDGPGLNFMAQPNGRYVARPMTPDLSDLDLWVELDQLGNLTRTLGCAGGLQPRFHDLIAHPDGGYWIMCDETRTMDLTAHGGVAGARVTGTVLQHLGPARELLFHWSPFDHFLITDLDPASRTGMIVNWTHGNSIDLDTDGNLLVSFRSLNEITKIDTQTGAVLWRLGGRRNQFTFAAGSSPPPFVGQHSLRVYAPNRVVLLDNIGHPLESRAERWIIDPDASVAHLVQSFGSVPAVRTLIGGSVQALPNNRTLVTFGTEGRVEEYDAGGAVRWRIAGNAGYVFRAQRIHSLYGPGIGWPR